MPTNLPPHYYDAEKRYREGKTAAEKIAALEEMLAIMPKHKGTDHLKADLRRRIAKLQASGGKKSAIQRASVTIQKEGAAQVPVIGPPNTGKSQLVTVLTNATTQVAEYPFTTFTAIPGMMPFENIQIQLLDMPPLVPGSTLSLVPPNLVRADALLVVLDLSEDPLEQMETVTSELGLMRIAMGPPPEEEEPESMLRHFKKTLIVGNKIDMEEAEDNFGMLEELYGDDFPLIAVSALHGTGLEDLRSMIFEVLEIIRIYTKTPGQQADMNDPIVLPAGSTLQDAATEVHKDFAANLKFARVWGSGKHDGVMVKRDHVLQDGDIVELHL